MKQVLALALMLWNLVSASQQIRVVDAETSIPIKEALIILKNEKTNVVTDGKGFANISEFSSSDSFVIRKLSYETKTIATTDAKDGTVIRLLPNSITASEIVISASKWEQESRENANYEVLINKKKIELLNPQTTADLLQQSGSVFVQKSQAGGGSPMLRGFATNRVLLVVDGVRFNTSIFRAGNVQNVLRIDANAVENTEVVFGPGSLIYGSDAIGGVMDFHTLAPKVSNTGKLQVTGNALARFSSANLEKTAHLDFNLGLKKWALLSSFTYSDYDDTRMGSNGAFDFYLRNTYQKTFTRFDSSGKKMIIDTFYKNQNNLVQKGSGFHQWNFMQKVRFTPNSSHRFTAAFHLSRTGNVPRYDRLTETNSVGTPTFSEWYYGPEEWLMAHVEYSLNKSNSAFNEMKINVAYQQNKESRNDRRYGSRWLRRLTEKVDAVNANIDFNKNFKNKYFLFYGMEGVVNINKSNGNRLDVFNDTSQLFAARYPNSIWMSYAAYVSGRIKFNEKWILNAGIRYNHFYINSKFDTVLFKLPFDEAKLNFGAATGSLGLVFLPTSSWKVYANFSTGFRAPNVDDIGKVFESAPGVLVVPNKDLKAEYALNAEAGIEKRFNNTALIYLGGYYNYLLNALTLAPFKLNESDSLIFDGRNNALRAIQNSTFAYVWGVQTSLKFNFGKGFGAYISYNYQFGRENQKINNKDTLVATRHVAPMFGTAHLTYQRGKWSVDFYGDFSGALTGNNFASKSLENVALFPTDELGNRYSPAWFTLNFKAAYIITNYLILNAGIENITDNRYRTYSSGISAPGVNFVVGLRGRF